MARYLKGVMADQADTTVFKKRIDAMAKSALRLVRQLD